MNKKDQTQIVLNLIAGVVLYLSLGGAGSFWPFASFTIIAYFMLAYTILTKGPGMWVWITKSTTYLFLCVKFSATAGDIKTGYIVMIVVATVFFIASKLFTRYHTEAIRLGLWGQNIAYSIGGVLYILAVQQHPDAYNINHMMFWGINAVSYALLIRDIWGSNNAQQRPLLIVFYFAFITCLVYIIVIMIAKWL